MGSKDVTSAFRAAARGIDFEWPTVNLLEACAEYGFEVADVAYLAANENPYGASPRAMAAAAERLLRAAVYPSPSLIHDELHNEYADVRRALAAYCGVPEEMIMPGPGSETVLRYVTQAFIDSGDEVVCAPESYSGHPWATQIMGGVVKFVPLVDYRFNVDGFLAAVSERTKMVWLCSPNNPTGTIITDEELRRLIEGIPPSTVIVCDQAYQELVDDPEWGDGTKYLLAGHRNVVVLRTLSKAFGLAGMRIGYAIADPRVCTVIDHIREPYYISGPACAAGLAALEDSEWREDVVGKLQASRRSVGEALTALGCHVIPSQCNFLLVDTGRDAGEMYELLLRRGIVVRPGSLWGYTTHIRVSMGTEEENHRFLAAMTEILVPEGSAVESGVLRTGP
jgi:histidinol-phosphate aminotransferase